jgi:hypothetical protein
MIILKKKKKEKKEKLQTNAKEPVSWKIWAVWLPIISDCRTEVTRIWLNFAAICPVERRQTGRDFAAL